MAQYFSIHPSHPQGRLINQAADIVRSGGLVVYPTDTAYALGCHIGDRAPVERIRQLRRLDKSHLFTLTCRDLSEIALYARVDNANYRILKHFTPGPFTFILPASREVPRRLVHPKRRTIGLRIPDNVVALALLEALGEPMMTATMRLPGQSEPLTEPEEIRAALEKSVDVIIDAGTGGALPTTVVDLTGDSPEIRRQGMGVFA